MTNKLTLVTGLWDLGRGSLEDFGRSFQHYLECFDKLLNLDVNMIIYVPSYLKEHVEDIRKGVSGQTAIRIRELSSFGFPFSEEVHKIRRNPDWYTQADWLPNSPQAQLAYYNPVVMSKFFMLNDAAIENPFNSKYFFWIDGGLTNTVRIDLLENAKKAHRYLESTGKNFLFLAFPYVNETEVHGFKTRALNEYCGVHAEYVCRGGFFGGTKEEIQSLNGEYYGILEKTLQDGYMGTEENIHTILSYRYPHQIQIYPLEESGLLGKFFEHLIIYPDSTNSLAQLIKYDKRKKCQDIRTSLYVLTFNSPKQFEALCNSIDYHEPAFLETPRRILIDNSTDFSTYQEYQNLCNWYGFEHIKKADNLGICGGRQFAAEHFQESDSEYYMFLEDDMLFSKANEEDYRDDFENSAYIENLYEKSLMLMHQGRYDFLKLSFKEFYGDNSKQWAWHNVPDEVKHRYFAGIDDLPDIQPTRRRRYRDLSAREGTYYYCNWPAWFSREGNQKVFLNTKWAHPHEQTWMSHVFQLQMLGKIKSAVLELSPIDHNRFEFYEAEERKES